MAPLLWRSRIALLELEGTLGGRVRPGEWVPLLSALERDPRARAVVLEIDSPGGTVAAADALRLAVGRVAQKKPAIAFIRGLGTSGAYLVATAATRVIAQPSALVGAIGVISLHPLVQDLLQKIGVRVNVTKSSTLKDMGAFYREPTPEEQQKQQELVDEFYRDFVAAVAQGRRLSEEVARQYATGEVFTARRAQALGLIDEIGDRERALDLASELGRVPRRLVVVRPRRSWTERLVGRFAAALVSEVAAELELRLAAQVRS